MLCSAGALPRDAPAQYLAACERYAAGQAGIAALHRACVAPLALCNAAQLAQWQQAFATHIAPLWPPARRLLVQQHLRAGDCCVLVTATSRLLAEPLAALFGMHTLLATEPALNSSGAATGEIDGEPCHGAAKLRRVQAWLAGQGLRLADLARSHFYSDSASDLPLLCSVTHPVAVDPDAALLAHALASGWQVMRPDVRADTPPDVRPG